MKPIINCVNVGLMGAGGWRPHCRMIYASAFITNILLILSILYTISKWILQVWNSDLFGFSVHSPHSTILPIFVVLIQTAIAIAITIYAICCFPIVLYIVCFACAEILPHIFDDERIKCIHLTDIWKQFKSIPTLSEYELGTLLFVFVWNSLSLSLFLSQTHSQYTIASFPRTESDLKMCQCWTIHRNLLFELNIFFTINSRKLSLRHSTGCYSFRQSQRD